MCNDQSFQKKKKSVRINKRLNEEKMEMLGKVKRKR